MPSRMLRGFYDSASFRSERRAWSGGTRKEVKFSPFPRRDRMRLYHDARRLDRNTRGKKNHQYGKIGRNALRVLEALIFDFLDCRSGRLDPCYATIAYVANVSVRSVARGLAALKDAGVLDWIRRLHWEKNGTIVQDSNAYTIQRDRTQWKGYAPAPPPPKAPEPGTWGDHPPSPSPLELAAEALARGAPKTAQAALELEESGLAATLGRLNKSRMERGR